MTIIKFRDGSEELLSKRELKPLVPLILFKSEVMTGSFSSLCLLQALAFGVGAQLPCSDNQPMQGDTQTLGFMSAGH